MFMQTGGILRYATLFARPRRSAKDSQLYMVMSVLSMIDIRLMYVLLMSLQLCAIRKSDGAAFEFAELVPHTQMCRPRGPTRKPRRLRRSRRSRSRSSKSDALDAEDDFSVVSSCVTGCGRACVFVVLLTVGHAASAQCR